MSDVDEHEVGTHRFSDLLAAERPVGLFGDPFAENAPAPGAVAAEPVATGAVAHEQRGPMSQGWRTTTTDGASARREGDS